MKVLFIAVKWMALYHPNVLIKGKKVVEIIMGGKTELVNTKPIDRFCWGERVKLLGF